MTDTDTPSGGSTAAGDSVAPGRPDEQALAALPDKVRVHALARVVGTSSRELLAVLARIGVGARSAQSSVDRGVVAQVMDDLFPPPGGPVADPVAEAAAALTPAARRGERAERAGGPAHPGRRHPDRRRGGQRPGLRGTDVPGARLDVRGGRPDARPAPSRQPLHRRRHPRRVHRDRDHGGPHPGLAGRGDPCRYGRGHR